jgi:hypothetical protein
VKDIERQVKDAIVKKLLNKSPNIELAITKAVQSRLKENIATRYLNDDHKTLPKVNGSITRGEKFAYIQPLDEFTLFAREIKQEFYGRDFAGDYEHLVQGYIDNTDTDFKIPNKSNGIMTFSFSTKGEYAKFSHSSQQSEYMKKPKDKILKEAYFVKDMLDVDPIELYGDDYKGKKGANRQTPYHGRVTKNIGGKDVRMENKKLAMWKEMLFGLAGKSTAFPVRLQYTPERPFLLNALQNISQAEFKKILIDNLKS